MGGSITYGWQEGVSSDRLRLFFAIEPPRKWREALVDATAWLPASREPVDRIHITLAFLGSRAKEEVAQLAAIGRSIQWSPFLLECKRVVSWSHSMAVARTEPSSPLDTLQQHLAEVLVAVDYQEERNYRPHVTLARHCPPFKPRPLQLPPFQVEDFVLMATVGQGGGRCYQVLRRFGSGAGIKRHFH